jgi:predicted transcriptional regulator
MAREPQDVTDAELAVLEVLWREGTATVRQLRETVYPDDESQHTTVQKLLDRLDQKGYVTRDRSVWPHLLQAAVEREQIIGNSLRTMAKKLCGGKLQPLLTHLIRETKLSQRERQSLRKLLDELDTG